MQAAATASRCPICRAASLRAIRRRRPSPRLTKPSPATSKACSRTASPSPTRTAWRSIKPTRTTPVEFGRWLTLTSRSSPARRSGSTSPCPHACCRSLMRPPLEKASHARDYLRAQPSNSWIGESTPGLQIICNAAQYCSLRISQGNHPVTGRSIFRLRVYLYGSETQLARSRSGYPRRRSGILGCTPALATCLGQ